MFQNILVSSLAFRFLRDENSAEQSAFNSTKSDFKILSISHIFPSLSQYAEKSFAVRALRLCDMWSGRYELTTNIHLLASFPSSPWHIPWQSFNLSACCSPMWRVAWDERKIYEIKWNNQRRSCGFFGHYSSADSNFVAQMLLLTMTIVST